MRIAVCDDCSEDALCLKGSLKGQQDVQIYLSAKELLAELKNGEVHYDLYLLDIYMNDSMDGIELAKELRGMDKEAFDLYAVQYLLKPVQEDALSQLLERVAGKLSHDREQSLKFKMRGQSSSIPYGKIRYISSREHTISIFCTDGTVQECRGKLNEFEQRICGDIFIRCHQSFLVNIYQVDNLSGSDLIISGQRVPISRKYYTQVKRRYQEILFEEVD